MQRVEQLGILAEGNRLHKFNLMKIDTRRVIKIL